MNFNEFLNEKVTVLDNRYVRSHGKAPKGWGKWMFSYDEKGNDYFEIPGSMSYTDAKKWVMDKAKEDGKSYVYVMEGAKPAGAPDWHDSDAPDAEGRFKELGIKDLAAWLIKTRDKDLRKITGSLNQQIVFNRGEDKEYADKMEKVRKEVYRQLGREDLLEAYNINKYSPNSYAEKVASGVMSFEDAQEESGLPFTLLMKLVKKIDKAFKLSFENNEVEEESNEVNEKMKVIMRSLLMKMIPSAFGPSSSVSMRKELEAAIAAAITPVLVKYDYVVESEVSEEEGRDTLAELNEMTLGQLERIEDYAEMIAERMEGGQELESWMFSQITVALENLNSVHDAMDGDDGVEEGFTMNNHILQINDIINEKAEGNRGPIDNPDIEKALKTKAEESGIKIGLLRIVMRRGMDAWNRSHYEGTTQEQWGYARVNAFIEKGKGTWGGADKDVAAEVKK
jgi:hypothetical protein